jgi:hypothetical protein
MPRVRSYALNVLDMYSPPLSVRTVLLDLLPGLPFDLFLPLDVEFVGVRLPVDRIRSKKARRLVLDRHHVAFVFKNDRMGIGPARSGWTRSRETVALVVLVEKDVRCCFRKGS